MCLSTAYLNKMDSKSILMNNVMKIDYKNGFYYLTDLMERTMEIKGKLLSANLVDGYVFFQEE